ncbi:M23 family metallopeptidase [Polynucleobacter sp. CS-Odin-A6]|uniref:M23 family metallopeptidase n=1 Tax=Polynucleobacter sp. CS-Odin-A6 TaxID=2689106 RepID=UPI001C0E49D3|nr:M23 family metallopeptidase [Polynucleobacter sp. CS-Odin-A6]MBU3621815.1 M23 family metallopeptidase [Polynucleobacter sp. CS-Odin-A6]
MQIIWISGATSHYRKFNITKTQLTRFAAVLSFLFIMIGSAVYFLGFRVAIKFDPDMARDMGGVITSEELYHLEDEYRERLTKLQNTLKSMDQKIETLSKINEQYAALATPLPMKEKRKEKDSGDNAGRGGPYIPFFSPHVNSEENTSLRAMLKKTLDSTGSLNKKIQSLEEAWLEKYERLIPLPTKPPLVAGYGLSSNFGARMDPITNNPAFHPGIDFNAKPGTPVLAAGSGTVIKAKRDPELGNVIEIKHTEGFTSLYAHCQKLLVEQGDTVSRGQLIAEVGNTGRSTGPHLHFSVYRNGNLLNPMDVLAFTKSSANKEN